MLTHYLRMCGATKSLYCALDAAQMFLTLIVRVNVNAI